MKLSTSVVFTTVLLGCVSMIHAYLFTSYVGVVLGVTKTNRCNCVNFVSAGVTTDGKVKAMERNLSSRNIFSLASEITHIGRVLEKQHKHCSHPLVVFFEETKDRGELIKLSRKRSFSNATWLIFLEHNEQLESTLQDIEVVFDCKFLVARFDQGQDVSITEVYRVAPHLPLQKYAFGSWSPVTGFTGPKLELYSRRNNLQGIVLKVSTWNDMPITVYNPNRPSEIGGYYGSIWQIIAKQTNFTMQVTPPDKGSYGTRLANGSWDGLMGQMQRNAVDLGVSGTTINTYRLEVPRFSVPLYHLKFKIYIREPEELDVSWGSILSPFSPPLWGAVLLTAFATSIFLSHLYKFDRRYNLRTDRRKVSLYDTMFFLFGAIFCQQSHDQNPRSLACCIVYVVAYLCGMIIIGSYSAMLISFLAVFIPTMPFTDLEGLLADTSYSLGAQKDASSVSYFKESRDPILQELYSKKFVVGLDNAPLTHVEGFQRICDRKYAHIGATALLPMMSKIVKCLIFPLPQAVYKALGGFATYPKNSSYAGFFDHIILGMFQSGLIRRLSMEWNFRAEPQRVMRVKSVSFEAITPFLSIIFGGVLLGTTLLVIEKLVFRFQRKKSVGVVRKKTQVCRVAKKQSWRAM